MKVKFKRFDKTLSLPAYKTKGAAAFDLSAREENDYTQNEPVQNKRQMSSLVLESDIYDI